jgi:hypothetical protein
VAKPLTFDQVDEATITGKDLPRATVTRGGQITAPCSESAALAKVPVSGAGSEADVGALVFASQPGSFATETQAKAFVAAIQRTKPCTFTHSSGVTESVSRVEPIPPTFPGVTGVRVVYTVDLGRGTTYVGLDAYLAIGRVVGVFSCEGPVENVDEVDQLCSDYGATFGGKLGAVYDNYG